MSAGAAPEGCKPSDGKCDGTRPALERVSAQDRTRRRTAVSRTLQQAGPVQHKPQPRPMRSLMVFIVFFRTERALGIGWPPSQANTADGSLAKRELNRRLSVDGGGAEARQRQLGRVEDQAALQYSRR